MSVPDLREATALRAYLAERDLPCPRCGFNLRGLTTTRCPECNHRLELRVAVSNPAMTALVLTIIGLSAGTGAALFVAGATAVYSLVDRPPPLDWLWLLFMVPCGIAVALGVPLSWLVSHRACQRFLSLPRRRRQYIALGAWLLGLALYLFWLVLFVLVH